MVWTCANELDDGTCVVCSIYLSWFKCHAVWVATSHKRPCYTRYDSDIYVWNPGL